MTQVPRGASPAAPREGRYAPRPGAAPAGRMIAAQAALELRMLLRNGEQLLLTVIIPALLLVLFGTVDVVDVTGPGEGERVDFLAPGVLAVAVLATAFTSQAIATGFERRYGVLKRLGASPLPRWGLLAGKTCAALAVLALQTALLSAVALALGWSPHGNPAAAAALMLLGAAACTGLGLLMAGTLRAEATLAAANLVFVLLLFFGGVIVPLEEFPGPVADALALLPSGALSEGLRAVLREGQGLPWGEAAVLAAWAAAGLGAAARWFRWE
ncbi:ABC transporter permease [Streptomyces sp. DSM 44917]|uniref:Transport permease protein n=1 Tax=Streptomyces boetiae TaxID=3075541 RepID=A0ABU2L594_9ACTN|nr:ABC transporter permease [Streptomyces sp. DSM 44917]MDT0306729.1 ABC transporter permease [Streptomyces sp. DSM 44917]